MTLQVEAEHVDDGACIITGRHSQLDYHEPGEFRRSRDPGSHLDPNKRVLISRRFHDRVTFEGWRDELNDGRYRCWDGKGEPVRDVPVRLDERLGCMVPDWKDEETVQALARWIPAGGIPSFAELQERLSDCSDEAVSHVYEQAETLSERCHILSCLTVAILRQRYRLEEWPPETPDWWRKGKAYPPEEPYWPHVVGKIINKSWRTAYRRHQEWNLFEKFAINGNPVQIELFLDLGKQAWNVILQSPDKEAAFVEAADLKAEVGEVRGDMLAARLQERGLLAKAKWEYGCPCGCGWWGRQRDFSKRQMTEDK